MQEALDRLMVGRTVLVVAHRLSTIRGADRIVVVQGGAVAEAGTHDELVALDGAYSRLVSRQLHGGGGGGSAAAVERQAAAPHPRAAVAQAGLLMRAAVWRGARGRARRPRRQPGPLVRSSNALPPAAHPLSPPSVGAAGTRRA